MVDCIITLIDCHPVDVIGASKLLNIVTELRASWGLIQKGKYKAKIQ